MRTTKRARKKMRGKAKKISHSMFVCVCDDDECVKPLPFIWNLWRYAPLIGQYRIESIDANGRYNLKHYGPIVREEITSSHRILHLFDPVHMQSMFAQEGRYPHRRSHRALIRYRMERPEIYRSGGIFPDNGPEWARVRDLFKRPMLMPNNVRSFDQCLDSVAIDLIHLIRIERNTKTMEVADFQYQMYRWALESICSIMLDVRIGCLRSNLSSDSEPIRLIQAAHRTNEAVMRTELYNSWQTDTSDYRLLVDGQNVMAHIIGRHLNKRIDEIEKQCPRTYDGSTQTMLQQLIRSPLIDRKDLFGFILDCVLAGIDTTSITVSFVMYHLARNPQCQEELRKQIQRSIDNDDHHHQRSSNIMLNAEQLASIPLLKAVIKETLRLNPISIGVGRLTTEPLIIGGYRIPEETMIITQNQVSCQLEQYFPCSKRFEPKRWLNSSARQQRQRSSMVVDNDERAKRFLWLPFGHGTRMCIGRRIAELEMQIVITRLLANFRVEYHHENVGIRTNLINVPDRPIRLLVVVVVDSHIAHHNLRPQRDNSLSIFYLG
ncbi:hypothetical protein RDWZM_010469 [Blomia tropicalis]|uniref:Uncharacterized protein n=1 Tax=Blomia tropicalis TaxID=40697 RepID=A0A9Q0LYU8_BLOTA|nr:hypothetical protein RDWZM_010469 [Blomia tropicalis]